MQGGSNVRRDVFVGHRYRPRHAGRCRRIEDEISELPDDITRPRAQI